MRWAMDGKFRAMTLVDGCTRECPAIEVDVSLPGGRVVRVLDRVARARDYPVAVVCDNVLPALSSPGSGKATPSTFIARCVIDDRGSSRSSHDHPVVLLHHDERSRSP